MSADAQAVLAGGEVAQVDDVEGLIAPIVLAFSADPFVRWMLPGSSQFLTHFSELTRLHGHRTMASGGAYGRKDARGGAFWYAPGVHPDADALGAVFAAAGVLARVSAVWQRAAAYEPSEPHWYLRQIGIDPALQRNGHGSALMEAGLAEIDRRGELAYLEATSRANVAFYERHGFAVLGEVEASDSAMLWPMLREPV